VVESSLGIPTGCAGKLRWQTAGMFSEAAMAEPWKCVRVLIGTTSIRLSEDNHDSCVTCTTSAECKTVITAVLMVMSGMNPHMIRWNLRWVWFGLVGWFVELDLIRLWVGHGVTP
jgi:hypothetical protein